MARQGTPHDEYDLLEQVGTGSFGTVHRAQHKATHQVVAIKVMKRTSHSAESTNTREYKTLKQLARHPNIVQLHDSFTGPSKELYFIMEYMDQGNLYQLIKQRRETNSPLNHAEIRSILRQILKALAHLHQQGIFHRDMKPENLLISSPPTPTTTTKDNEQQQPLSPVIKLADFGLARELRSRPPYTDYVSTRWYRAPEVLLRSTHYSYPVDLWAVGAIFAELTTLRPLFPGRSEVDQLYRITQVLGKPERRSKKQQQLHPQPVSDREWADGVKLAHKMGFDFVVQTPTKPLAKIIPTATESMLDLLKRFLVYDPSRRIKASEALRSTFLCEDKNHALYSSTCCPEKDFDVLPLPPPRKSLLWSKGVTSSSTAPRLPQDIREALRISKSKTIDRLHRKSKPSLRMDHDTSNLLHKSNSANDFQHHHHHHVQQHHQHQHTNSDNPPQQPLAEHLPSIPVLSPIFAEWGERRFLYNNHEWCK
ncbi:protein [Lichtheimia corymbifera JMRC:FSU:9682]|uniref:Protein n=1 Tax=Lichtheimia corymbifera JMRC:FSU:9682 TaxID=1263082 RepID=A0A068SGI0_9FUNG|nr:protein [Lichtheimia corymbifera JMRC:FSU:9682]